MINYKILLKKIKALVFDVDGVFTDGQVFMLPREEFIRAFNIKDGFAVQHCIKMGFAVGIISGGKSDEIVTRFSKLGVTDIYMGSSSKLASYEDFRQKYHFTYDETLYMGDDLPDYEIMEKAGLPVCPRDAAIEIRQIAKYISDKEGGKGCVRDIIEQVMRVQNKWFCKESFEW
jgi:3-deoxy-D-manno-octulosonate 8-phosphate phosphatase (KDO 8-P phosphatase)